MTEPALAAALPESLPAGLLPVREPLSSPAAQGWGCYGAGTCEVQDQSPWAERISGSATRLEPTDEATPAIHARGARWTLADLAIVRRERKGVGILVDHQGAFNGAKATIDRVGLCGFERAIQVGAEMGRHGNDNLTLSKLAIANCGSAVYLGAAQSMHHAIRDAHSRRNDRFLHVAGGGKVVVDQLDTDCYGCLLYTEPEGIGPNNGSFAFRDTTVDGAKGAMLWLVDQTGPHYLRAEFDGLRLPSRNQGNSYVARIQGADSRLTLRRVENLTRTSKFYLDGGATLTLTDSDLPCDPRELVGGKGVLRVRDCSLGGMWIQAAEVGL